MVPGTARTPILTALLLSLLLGSTAHAEPPGPPPRTLDRLQEFKWRILKQFRAGEPYQPAIEGNLEAVDAPVQAILKQLPGVVSVTVPVPVERPKHRIVHLKDWHYLPKELFAADIRDVRGEAVPDTEIDDLYEEFLLEVQLVQHEQMALLRCLIKHHGLKRVLCEGLTKEDMPIYEAKISGMRRVEEKMPLLRQQRAEANLTHAPMQPKERLELEKAVAILNRHHINRLQIGAAGRLYLAGELEEVLPLDDAKLLRQSNPVGKDGSVKLDSKVIEARQDAQVRAMLGHGPFALCILGGAHDLADNLKRLGRESCELVVVETIGQREFAGNDQ